MDDLEIPAFLRREDTEGSKAARAALVKTLLKATYAAPPPAATQSKLTQHDLDVIAELTAGAASVKKAKTKARISKLLASKNGAAASMPLQGKAALELIAGEGPPPDSNEARTTQRGIHVKNGKKETALQEARESELSKKLEPTLEASVVGIEGAAAVAAAEPNKETTVKTKKKALNNARTPVKNGHANGDDRATKMRQIADLMRGKHGVTTPEALAIVGWPSVSMPAVAKAAGIKLRKEKGKGEKHTRYFAA